MRSLINSLSLLTTANFSKLKELYVVAVLNIRPVAVFSCESVAYLLCSISTFSLLLKLQLVLLNSWHSLHGPVKFTFLFLFFFPFLFALKPDMSNSCPYHFFFNEKGEWRLLMTGMKSKFIQEKDTLSLVFYSHELLISYNVSFGLLGRVFEFENLWCDFGKKSLLCLIASFLLMFECLLEVTVWRGRRAIRESRQRCL